MGPNGLTQSGSKCPLLKKKIGTTSEIEKEKAVVK